MPDAFYSSENDARILRKIARDYKNRPPPFNTRLLPNVPDKLAATPDIYIALGSVPALSGVKPGRGLCIVYKVIMMVGTGTGTGSETYELREVSDTLLPVFNVSAQNLTEWFPVARDAFGNWIAMAGGGGRQLIRVTDIIGPQEVGTGCQPGTGTGIPDEGCGMIFHHAISLSPDPYCQQYTNAGGCVYATELKGRRIPPDDYWADFIGIAPTVLQGVPVDPTKTPCVPDAEALVYSIDLGAPARTILVGARVGRLCVGTGTGSANTSSSTLGGHSQNLVIYMASEYVWNPLLCSYTAIGSVLIANAEGCELDSNEWVTGVYHTMVKREQVPSMAPERCLPLYITTERQYVAPVGDVECEDGHLVIYSLERRADKLCGYELAFWHTAGCCDCGGTGGTGTFSACGFDPAPRNYDATISGVTNTGFCSTCTLWDGTYRLNNPDGGSCWSVEFTPHCPGIACVAMTLCCIDEYMVLDICGAQYRKLKSLWNALGSNTMDNFGVNDPRCNWPATVTVVAVV